MNLENQLLINQFKNSNPSEIALKLQGKNVDKKYIIEQIEGFQKAKSKLPEWTKNEKIIFPPKLNLEQCSSQATALYKSSLIKGVCLIDLTGGFGVDSFYFSKNFKSIIYCEKNQELAQITKSNFESLGVKNCSLFLENGIEVMSKINSPLSAIYLDPARRNTENKKLFKLDECEPNILEIQSFLFEKSDTILIKTSPMLDIEFASKSLLNLSEIHIVSVENECKEVLFLLKKTPLSEPQIYAINISGSQEIFSFSFTKSEENICQSTFSYPQKYLYEPNTSILKSGAFKLVGKRFNLQKLASNTHLYSSNLLESQFPGKIFEIIAVTKYKDSSLLKKQANVVTRNFPFSVEEVKKQMKIKDGGPDYIFACKDSDKKLILIHCTKIKHTQ